MKIKMRNQLMKNKRRKGGKIVRSEMTNIDKEYFVKNVIMKVI
jgi:hypothetical protein